MLKLLGLLAIVSASTGIGILFSVRLRVRVTQLKALQLMMNETLAKIRYSAADVPTLLAGFADQPRYEVLWFLPELAEHCRAGRPVMASLRSAINPKSPRCQLTEEDIALIYSFGEKLGTSDIAGQVDNCQLHIQLAEEQLTAASKEYREKGRLYTMLGFFAGLTLAIFLI